MTGKPLEIEVQNLRLRTIIGFNDWEREKPQDIVISVRLTYDAGQAIKTDDVEHAVDYKTITKTIIKKVEDSSFNLLESLADMIYNTIHSFSGVQKVYVKVEKPHCLRFCDNVIVRLSDYD
ncbi:MAG TPA: dihydroneopterin aldolase [Balneolales bacterium]|nr:dihydroneopterin aldolase [Balneolales bacterium]